MTELIGPLGSECQRASQGAEARGERHRKICRLVRFSWRRFALFCPPSQPNRSGPAPTECRTAAFEATVRLSLDVEVGEEGFVVFALGVFGVFVFGVLKLLDDNPSEPAPKHSA